MESNPPAPERPLAPSPTSIRVVGMVVELIAGFSSVALLSSGLALMFTGEGQAADSQPDHFLLELFTHLWEICLILSGVMALCSLGGYGIVRNKLWGNRLVTICMLMIIGVFGFIGISTTYILLEKLVMVKHFSVIPGVFSLFIVIFAVMVVRYLNRKSIIKYFS